MLLLPLLALPLMHDISSPDLNLLDLSNTVLLSFSRFPLLSSLVSRLPSLVSCLLSAAGYRLSYSLLTLIHLPSQPSHLKKSNSSRHRHFRQHTRLTRLPSLHPRPHHGTKASPRPDPRRHHPSRAHCHHSRPELPPNPLQKTAKNMPNRSRG